MHNNVLPRLAADWYIIIIIIIPISGEAGQNRICNSYTHLALKHISRASEWCTYKNSSCCVEKVGGARVASGSLYNIELELLYLYSGAAASLYHFPPSLRQYRWSHGRAATVAETRAESTIYAPLQQQQPIIVNLGYHTDQIRDYILLWLI